MLQARIYLIQIILYVKRPYMDQFRKSLENSVIPLWNDYLKNKDNVLKLFDQNIRNQDAVSHEVTIFLQNTMSICLFASLGHFVISNLFKF